MADALKSSADPPSPMIPSRSEIKRGLHVGVETKADQGTGRLTYGTVADILTSSEAHPHGIKVRLKDENVGRVKEIGAKPS